jgi:predicted nucleic acid-binding protein
VNKSLLDTDILSEVLKGINPTVASNAAAYRQAFGRYSLSSVTVMEVISGLQRNQSVRRIQKFLTDINGGRDRLAMPVKKPLAHLALDLEETLGQRGLRDAEGLGRLAEAGVVGQGQHVPVVSHFHAVPPRLSGR